MGLDRIERLPIYSPVENSPGTFSTSCQGECASHTGASFSASWHCIYTLPSKEAAADRAMQRAGFETYFPQYLMVWRDRQRHIRPLFPRYTFVRFADTDAYKLVIHDSLGQEVGRLMVEPTTRKPYTIPTPVIESLLAQAAPDRIIYPPQPRVMVRGDAGRVVSKMLHDRSSGASSGNPLEGFTGICSRTSRDRVWLLMEIMGRKSEVQFDRDAVEIL